MVFSIFFVACLLETKPLQVRLADPVISLDIQSLDGESLTLEQVANNTFCFFLSVHCSYCRKAMNQIQIYFIDKHCVFLFLDDQEKVSDFLNDFPRISQTDVYIITKPDQLKAPAIEKLPALLAYKSGKLKAAVHGDFNDNVCKLIIASYKKGSKKEKR